MSEEHIVEYWEQNIDFKFLNAEMYSTAHALGKHEQLELRKHCMA